MLQQLARPCFRREHKPCRINFCRVHMHGGRQYMCAHNHVCMCARGACVPPLAVDLGQAARGEAAFQYVVDRFRAARDVDVVLALREDDEEGGESVHSPRWGAKLENASEGLVRGLPRERPDTHVRADVVVRLGRVAVRGVRGGRGRGRRARRRRRRRRRRPPGRRRRGPGRRPVEREEKRAPRAAAPSRFGTRPRRPGRGASPRLRSSCQLSRRTCL